MAREQKPQAKTASLEAKVDSIMDSFGDEFTSDTNVLMLLHRKKDGGATKEDRRRLAWFIVHDKESYRQALLKLLILKDGHKEGDYRIYASSNPRNIVKAERLLKQRILQTDFDGKENKEYFWKRLDRKWISALMSDTCRDRSYFLWDIDDEDGKDMHGDALKKLADWEIVHQYRTKGGWHIITKPGNPEGILLDLKKDGLILLDY